MRLAEAVAALAAGELVLYPTETLYALGADALCPAALARLFGLKGREPGKPVALIAADPEMAFALALRVPAAARRLAAAFWPGPLTVVLPARPDLPQALVGRAGGVGVRVSSHPLARALAAGLGRPITATSANRSASRPVSTLTAARAAFGDKVKVYVEGGRLAGATPSTVVELTAAGFRILRPGAIAEDRIAAALGGRHRQ